MSLDRVEIRGGLAATLHWPSPAEPKGFPLTETANGCVAAKEGSSGAAGPGEAPGMNRFAFAMGWIQSILHKS